MAMKRQKFVKRTRNSLVEKNSKASVHFVYTKVGQKKPWCLLGVTRNVRK